MNTNDANQNPQWAWLGLLKWSLSYSDGTQPSDPDQMKVMSAEDKAFLEEVMKNGILDEGERMKEILKQVSDAMEFYQRASNQQRKSQQGGGEEEASMPKPQQEENENESNDYLDTSLSLLEELRDIVEQIDYARAFVSLQGLPFLFGALQEGRRNSNSNSSSSSSRSRSKTIVIPQPIRQACLGVLATMCQNNPPVQLQVLEMGGIKILSDLFFLEEEEASRLQEETDDSAKLMKKKAYQAKIMQALSAVIRNHATAEEVFVQVEQATELLRRGLELGSSSSSSSNHGNGNGHEILAKRTLFFLRALLTSDDSTRARVRKFQNCIAHVCDTYLQPPASATSPPSPTTTTTTPTTPVVSTELRELALEFLTALLEQRRSVNVLLLPERKQHLVGVGVASVAALRQVDEAEAEYAQVELELWETLLTQLARAEPDAEEEVLLLADGPATPEALPQ